MIRIADCFEEEMNQSANEKKFLHTDDEKRSVCKPEQNRKIIMTSLCYNLHSRIFVIFFNEILTDRKSYDESSWVYVQYRKVPCMDRKHCKNTWSQVLTKWKLGKLLEDVDLVLHFNEKYQS